MIWYIHVLYNISRYRYLPPQPCIFFFQVCILVVYTLVVCTLVVYTLVVRTLVVCTLFVFTLIVCTLLACTVVRLELVWFSSLFFLRAGVMCIWHPTAASLSFLYGKHSYIFINFKISNESVLKYNVNALGIAKNWSLSKERNFPPLLFCSCQHGTQSLIPARAICYHWAPAQELCTLWGRWGPG